MVRTITVCRPLAEAKPVLDAVEGGETFAITRRGNAVAELVPIGHRRGPGMRTDEIRRRFTGHGRIDYAAMRREIDEFFGDDDRIRDEDYE